VRGPALTVALVALVACSTDPPAVDTTLEPSTNVVSATPTPFQPKEGGVGRGHFDGLPFSRVVMTGGALVEAGERACGQFVGGPGAMEVRLYGPLRPGDYPLIATVGATTSAGERELAPAPRAGEATLTFGQSEWRGKVSIVEGRESRGARVRGRVIAIDAEGRPLDLAFDVPFAGCDD